MFTSHTRTIPKLLALWRQLKSDAGAAYRIKSNFWFSIDPIGHSEAIRTVLSGDRDFQGLNQLAILKVARIAKAHTAYHNLGNIPPLLEISGIFVRVQLNLWFDLIAGMNPFTSHQILPLLNLL